MRRSTPRTCPGIIQGRSTAKSTTLGTYEPHLHAIFAFLRIAGLTISAQTSRQEQHPHRKVREPQYLVPDQRLLAPALPLHQHLQQKPRLHAGRRGEQPGPPAAIDGRPLSPPHSRRERPCIGITSTAGADLDQRQARGRALLLQEPAQPAGNHRRASRRRHPGHRLAAVLHRRREAEAQPRGDGGFGGAEDLVPPDGSDIPDF